MKKTLRALLSPGLLIMVLLAGCSSNRINPNMTSEERLAYAKKLFEKGDYYKAKTQFTILVMNYQGTKIADESQYYLAESHYNMKEYILAASEYEKLIRNYPNSEFVDDAQFKLGMCYYKLSPHYALDQQYTRRAISEFQRFLEDYPNSKLKKDVSKKLNECRVKLAKKEFMNGELYRKLAYWQSAIIYYDIVLQNYYDTPYGEEALYRKGECLVNMEKWDEAKDVLQLFLQKYPKSHWADNARSKLKSLPKASGEKK